MITVTGNAHKDQIKQVRALAKKYKKLIPHWCRELKISVMDYGKGSEATMYSQFEYHRAHLTIYPEFFSGADPDWAFKHELMHIYTASLDTLLRKYCPEGEVVRMLVEECTDSLAIMVGRFKWD